MYYHPMTYATDKYILEHTRNNAEIIERLVRLMETTHPHLSSTCDYLLDEWDRVRQEINDEYEEFL